MKIHKIKNVDIEVCSAEQKIAANYADLWETRGKKILLVSEKEQPALLSEVAELVLASINEQDFRKRYNTDAIISAFKNGFLEWCKTPFGEKFSYEKIGKVFPLS